MGIYTTGLLFQVLHVRILGKKGRAIFCAPVYRFLILLQDGFVGFQTVIIKKKMSAQAFFNGYLSKPQNKDVIFT